MSAGAQAFFEQLVESVFEGSRVVALRNPNSQVPEARAGDQHQ
jgi:hypothetical protein